MKIKKVNLGPFKTNTYIVYDKKINESIIIDPSFDIECVLDFIRHLKSNITAILLTHAHIDHTVGIVEIKKYFPHVKIYMGQNEQLTLSNEVFNLSYLFKDIVTCKKADILLKDNDEVSFCGVKLKIIETPGHTSGSICYYIESQKILFTGDTLFHNTIGRFDLPGGNQKKLVNSIKNKLFKLDYYTIVMPGHGSSTFIGYEYENNPFLRGI